MKHATIAIPEDLDEALAAYGRARGVGPNPAAVVDAALRDLLESHGYLLPEGPFRPLRITPLPHHGEEADISITHDRYFARGADSIDDLPFRPFHVTPLHREDGPTDISENHDRYFADGESSGSG